MEYSKQLKNNYYVPSHSELYRDFHKIEEQFLTYVMNTLKINFVVLHTYETVPTTCSACGQQHKFKLTPSENKELEEHSTVYVRCPTSSKVVHINSNWNTPPPEEQTDTRLPNYKLDFEVCGWDIVYYLKYPDGSTATIYIEYKSSEEEWGKQFDAYIRQMKQRMQSHGVKDKQHPILITFDESLGAYARAAETVGFHLLVLPGELLEEMKK